MEEATVDISPVDLTYAAFLLPPLIALINQKAWKKEIKGLVFLGVCLAYSTLATVLRGDVNWHDWRNVVIQVFATTSAAYAWFWGPTRIAPTIEDKTSVSRDVAGEGALYDPDPALIEVTHDVS